MRAIALLLAASLSLLAADPSPRLTFIKTFPASFPPYQEINIDQQGHGDYREDVKDESPVQFQLSPEETAQLFQLSDQLEHFRHPVESGLKVANMGKKTFRFSGPNEQHEVEFNYSDDPNAKNLLDWFERIAETERNLLELERTVKFDKLGVQNAILRIEVSRDQKRLVAPQQFLPMLDRVAKSETFLHMSRARAASLADSIRAPKAP